MQHEETQRMVNRTYMYINLFIIIIVGSLSESRLKKRSLFSRENQCRRDKQCRHENHQNQIIIITIIENRHLFDWNN
jgi:hypothetical protein